ncbi:hypothetical protein ES703_84568 [subsurface metagenome]
MKLSLKRWRPWAYSWGVLSATCYALHPSIGKIALLDFNPQMVAALKAVFAALMIVLFLAVTKKLGLLKFEKRGIPQMALAGCCYTGMIIGFWIALDNMQITELMALYWCYPLIGLAMDMVQDRKINLKGIIFIAIGAFGVYLAAGSGLGRLLTLEFGLIWIGLAAFCTAAYFKVNEYTRIKNYNPLTRMTWHFLIGALLITLLYRNFDIAALGSVPATGWLSLVLLAAIPTLCGYLFLLKSIKKIGAVASGTLDFLEPVLAVIFAIIIFGESLTLIQAAGWVLISISLINISRVRRKMI